MEIGVPTASHFIFIPAVLIIGIVIGWILGSRAAQDAIAMEQRKTAERQSRNQHADRCLGCD